MNPLENTFVAKGPTQNGGGDPEFTPISPAEAARLALAKFPATFSSGHEIADLDMDRVRYFLKKAVPNSVMDVAASGTTDVQPSLDATNVADEIARIKAAIARLDAAAKGGNAKAA